MRQRCSQLNLLSQSTIRSDLDIDSGGVGNRTFFGVHETSDPTDSQAARVAALDHEFADVVAESKRLLGGDTGNQGTVDGKEARDNSGSNEGRLAHSHLGSSSSFRLARARGSNNAGFPAVQTMPERLPGADAYLRRRA